MRVVILGAGGQLGKEFENFLKDKEEVYAFSHSELDILDFEKILKKFQEIKPDCILNCSAYTKVDKAEEEKEECFKVNVIGVKNVSYASYKVKAKVVYFSTDYIFDGEKDAPYTEFDKPNPLSTYGMTKLLGEEYTKEFNPDHLILRISWLYGIHGKNFVKTIIEKGIKKKAKDSRRSNRLSHLYIRCSKTDLGINKERQSRDLSLIKPRRNYMVQICKENN